MLLMTKAIENAFKKAGYQGNNKMEDIKIIAKFFNPYGGGTWYCYEYEPEDRILWCFANLGDPTFAEIGTVSLDELIELKVPPFGLGIERDSSFPIGKYTLKEVWDKVKSGGHI